MTPEQAQRRRKMGWALVWSTFFVIGALRHWHCLPDEGRVAPVGADEPPAASTKQ